MANHVNLLVILFASYRYTNCVYLNLQDDAPCTWQNVSGKCGNIYRCPKAMDEISKYQSPAICAFEDKIPIVCCTECFMYHPERDLRNQIWNDNLGRLWHKPDSIAEKKFNQYLDKLEYPCKLYKHTSLKWTLTKNNCYSRHEFTSGREPTDFNPPRELNYMHTALLGYGTELQSAQWHCGGSVISENFILTTANCTASPGLGPVTFIVVGTMYESAPETSQWFRVKRIIPHPQYQPSSNYHDIALLETDVPIVFNSHVVPIGLIFRLDWWPNAIAWSELGHGNGLYETLESISFENLLPLKESECSEKFPPRLEMVDGYNKTIQACYGYEDKRLDTCEGDKGASIHVPDWSGCGSSILGVASVGRTCENKYSGHMLYTRVKPYVDWIESVVWPAEYAKREKERNVEP